MKIKREQIEEIIKVYDIDKLLTQSAVDIITDKINKSAEAPESTKFRASKGEKYYFIDIYSEGAIVTDEHTDIGVGACNKHFENGNYFLECSEAEQTAKEINLFLKLKKWVRENDSGFAFKPWEKTNYYIYYSNLENDLVVSSKNIGKQNFEVNFSSEEKAQACIDELGEEMKEVLGV